MLLREKDRKTLVKIFSSVTIPMEVLAYGSRVTGSAHEGSDLDLVIRSTDLKPLPMEVYGELCENIRDSNIPILIELRDWALLPKSFHKNIEQHHEVLFSNLGLTANEPESEYKKA
ncbi:MAG TPA: nucleotidyltransferase domain-containing protein [Saprospiraceae bacterium]|nr:nucleotidyltransferase domain-containing protein [Saprospiraceae bacterium]